MDEQKIAFTLIDFENLIKSLDSKGLLDDENYTLLTKAVTTVGEITGMVKE